MDKENGYILIGTVSAILLVFLFAFLVILLIYRKRKLEYATQVEIMNEKFANELLKTQLEVQEQTMKYIGREIHDNVGQKLTLASLYAQQIDHENKYPAVSERIVAVSEIINESLSELRSLSKNLTSDYIEQTDVVALVKNECDKITVAGFCRVNFNSAIANINASYPVKNIITRIIQEFMQNSLKHAACSVIDVNIDSINDGLVIHMADDGKGFAENETEGKGIGLKNIKKRAEAIGALATILSSPGVGTQIKLFIPSNKIKG